MAVEMRVASRDRRRRRGLRSVVKVDMMSEQCGYSGRDPGSAKGGIVPWTQKYIQENVVAGKSSLMLPRMSLLKGCGNSEY